MPPLEKVGALDYGYCSVRAANFLVPRLSAYLLRRKAEEMENYGRKLHETHAEFKRRVTWIAKLDQLIEEVSVEVNQLRTLLAAFEP